MFIYTLSDVVGAIILSIFAVFAIIFMIGAAVDHMKLVIKRQYSKLFKKKDNSDVNS